MYNKFRSVLKMAVILVFTGMIVFSDSTVYADNREKTKVEKNIASDSSGVRMNLEDGEYSIQANLEGGSGKAGIVSPALMIVKNGRAYVQLTWSSSNYDYMVVSQYIKNTDKSHKSFLSKSAILI